MALIGYARGLDSGTGHRLTQTDALRKAGCEQVFRDTVSGAQADRPGLAAALAYLRDGDVLAVWRLDRQRYALPHLIETMGALDASRRRVPVAVQHRHHHLGRRLHFSMCSARWGCSERDLIRERTKAVVPPPPRTKGAQVRRPPTRLRRAREYIANGLNRGPAPSRSVRPPSTPRRKPGRKPPTGATMTTIYLSGGNPPQPAKRFYTLTVAQTRSVPWTLIREWGWIGHPGTVRETWSRAKGGHRGGPLKPQAEGKRGYRAIGGQGRAERITGIAETLMIPLYRDSGLTVRGQPVQFSRIRETGDNCLLVLCGIIELSNGKIDRKAWLHQGE